MLRNDTLTQASRLGEKKALPCLPLVETSSFLGKPPSIPTSSPRTNLTTLLPLWHQTPKKKIGRKSRLLMGRGLAHKRYGNSLPMIHKMYLKDRLDGIPRTLLLTKRKALRGRKTYKNEDSPQVQDLTTKGKHAM